MSALPRALAARQRELVRVLRDREPDTIDWSAERTAAAAPGRPGVLSDYRRQHEKHYDFTPLRDGTPCGPTFHVYPTCRTLSDAGHAATMYAYRMCHRDFDLYCEDMVTGFFESKGIHPD